MPVDDPRETARQRISAEAPANDPDPVQGIEADRDIVPYCYNARMLTRDDIRGRPAREFEWPMPEGVVEVEFDGDLIWIKACDGYLVDVTPVVRRRVGDAPTVLAAAALSLPDTYFRVLDRPGHGRQIAAPPDARLERSPGYIAVIYNEDSDLAWDRWDAQHGSR